MKASFNFAEGVLGEPTQISFIAAMLKTKEIVLQRGLTTPTTTNCEQSNWLSEHSGVPQGAIFGANIIFCLLMTSETNSTRACDLLPIYCCC